MGALRRVTVVGALATRECVSVSAERDSAVPLECVGDRCIAILRMHDRSQVAHRHPPKLDMLIAQDDLRVHRKRRSEHSQLRIELWLEAETGQRTYDNVDTQLLTALTLHGCERILARIDMTARQRPSILRVRGLSIRNRSDSSSATTTA